MEDAFSKILELTEIPVNSCSKKTKAAEKGKSEKKKKLKSLKKLGSTFAHARTKKNVNFLVFLVFRVIFKCRGFPFFYSSNCVDDGRGVPYM